MQIFPSGDLPVECREENISADYTNKDQRAKNNAVQIFENALPELVEKTLEDLYQNIYCTLTRFRLYDSLAGVSTYLSTRSGRPDCLILFQVEQNNIRVLNQQISLEPDQIERFCSIVFQRYPSVRKVSFYALHASVAPGALDFPFQEVPVIEENIALLPKSKEAYLQKIPSQSRNNMLKKARRLHADYPSHEFLVLTNEEIGIGHLNELAALAARRMKEKGSRPYLASKDIPALVELARTHGSLGLIRIGGRIVAGTLTYCVGARRFSQMIAHDPELNSYGLGNHLQLQVILQAIDEGATEFWMMGGGIADKARFLARRQMLNSVTVYRSRMAALRGWPGWAANEIRKNTFRFKETVKRLSTGDSVRARSLVRVLGAVRAAKAAGRRVKRLGPSPPARD